MTIFFHVNNYIILTENFNNALLPKFIIYINFYFLHIKDGQIVAETYMINLCY